MLQAAWVCRALSQDLAEAGLGRDHQRSPLDPSSVGPLKLSIRHCASAADQLYGGRRRKKSSCDSANFLANQAPLSAMAF